MNKRLFVLIPLLSAFSSLFAQKVEFYGTGRAVVTNTAVSDTIPDTTSKTAGGYTLMDLGFDVSRGEILRANAILRVRNGFGSFDGDAVSFEFRQMRLEGLIGKIVKYELGDIDMALTPYTIHNFNPVFDTYESELFSVKRDVVNYENFYTDENTWRMQGLNTFTTLKFKKGIESLGLRAFGSRVLPADEALGQTDRFLYGGAINADQGKYAELGLNYVAMDDIAGTLQSTDVSYNNTVMTATVVGKYKIDNKFAFRLEAELGQSQYKHDVKSDTTGNSTADYKDAFNDVKVSAKYLPLGLKLTAGYRTVGANFISPGAQTRRYTGEGSLTTIPDVNRGVRSQTLFDRYSQEQGLTNRGLSPTLMGFAPMYNNVTPYGVATSNRKGLTIALSAEDEKERFAADVKFESLSEVSPVNVSESRKFTAIQAGAKVNVNRFLGWRKQISLQGSYASEATSRKELEVDLKSNMIDAGVDIEFLTRLHLLAGFKQFSAVGSEWVQKRNELNVYEEGADIETVNYDQAQTITAAGLKYNFSNRAFFVAQIQMLGFEDKVVKDVDNSYDLTQFYFNYTLNF